MKRLYDFADSDGKMTCGICNNKYTARRLSYHIGKAHGQINWKDYYDSHLKMKDENSQCQNPSCCNESIFTWDAHGVGYRKYCSFNCQMKHKWSTDDEWKNKMSRVLSESAKYSWTLPDYREKMLNIFSERATRQLLDPNSNWGNNVVPTAFYGKILMRSKWEIYLAEVLDSLKFNWIYEYKTFTLDNGRKYTPDFYLTRYDLYIEVKPAFYIDDYVRYKIDNLIKRGTRIEIFSEDFDWRTRLIELKV